MYGRSYEYKEFFLKHLDEFNTFIDIGANIGSHALRATKLGLKVVAIELDKDTYALLKRNVRAS